MEDEDGADWEPAKCERVLEDIFGYVCTGFGLMDGGRARKDKRSSVELPISRKGKLKC